MEPGRGFHSNSGMRSDADMRLVAGEKLELEAQTTSHILRAAPADVIKK